MLSLLLIVPIVATTALAQTGSNTTAVFSDLDANHPFKTGIQYLKQAQLLEGYPDGSFKPAQNINRAEFTKILVGALTSDPKGENCFQDVRSDWYAKYVCEAKSRGLIDGYPDGTFRPAENINFSEAAKIIANAFSTARITSQEGSDWYLPYVQTLASERAIPLTVNFYNENITRDEMAEMIYRLKAQVEDKASRTTSELSGEGFVKARSCAELAERQSFVRFNQSIDGNFPVMSVSPSRDVLTDEKSAVNAAPAESTAGGSAEYSTTNIQEAGVDEGDIIKNDGKYVYILQDGKIKIIEAYPAGQMKELVNFQLAEQEKENFYPSELYLNGDILVAIGNKSTNYLYDSADIDSSAKMIMPPIYYRNRTKVYVVDIKDRSKPKVLRAVEFDGNLQHSRRVDDYLYVVLNQYSNFYPMPYRSMTEPMVEDSSADNNAAESEFVDTLPKMLDTTVNKEELVAPCDQVYILPKPAQPNYVIAAAIPLNNLKQTVKRVVIEGDVDQMYASAENLYLIVSNWYGPFQGETQRPSSKIYRLAIDQNNISFAAEGKVPGTVLNQFSMDEHRGYLRIATTTTDWSSSSQSSNNQLYILDRNLKISGKLENLAPGERIYSARFMGDRGYLVTFKNVDPLFVFDLKDPAMPKVLGELKIPGYSDYLHPYDENHLIGFGKDVEAPEDGSEQIRWDDIKGFKMGLFDVTDPNNPKQKYTVTIGDTGTYSELLYNHKALLFDQEKNLIAFPITETAAVENAQCGKFTYSNCPTTCNKVCVPSTCSYENGVKICTSDCDGAKSCQDFDYKQTKTVFDGAYVYGLSLQDGFKLKGKITHLTAQDQSDLASKGYADYNKTINRLLYIGDNLYSISRASLLANKLSDLTAVGRIDFQTDWSNIWEY